MGFSIICGTLGILVCKTNIALEKNQREYSKPLKCVFYVLSFLFSAFMGAFFNIMFGNAFLMDAEKLPPAIETYELEPLYENTYVSTVYVDQYRGRQDIPSFSLVFNDERQELPVGKAKIRLNANVNVPKIEIHREHLKSPVLKFFFFDPGKVSYRIYLPDDNINGQFSILDYDYSTF